MIERYKLTLDESFAPCDRRHKYDVYIDRTGLPASSGVGEALFHHADFDPNRLLPDAVTVH
jgi:hypothetical protein